MRIRILTVLLVTALILSACGTTEEAPVVINDKIEDIAVSFVTDLSGGKYEKAYEEYHFIREVRSQLSKSALEAMWDSLTQTNGSFQEISGFTASKSQGYDIISVETAFEKAKLDLEIAFNADKYIAGIHYKPHAEQKEMPGDITETPVTFGEAEWKLSGVLTAPKDQPGKASPIVILVHGSGPNDRDETIGANKPFRDIAWGLAQKGIRTIRYDKRTYTYGAKMAADQNLTVYEETIGDAVHAVEYLMLSSSIAPGDIYILGHSLGGTLIPRIAQKAGLVSGYIMMSAAVTPLEDLMVEQIQYISNFDGFVTPQERKTIQSYESMRDNVKKLSASSKFGADQLFGVPAPYWLDLKSYDPLQAANEIKQPLLILQGERDYQVPLREFNLLKEALKDKENVTFKSYEGLNHIMMYGTEKSSPADYDKAGEVDSRVIADIASWIQQQGDGSSASK